MWSWTRCGLSPSFCSPFLDNFENNVPFFPLTALCHVCLSCKLLKTGAVPSGLHGAQQRSLLVMPVSCGSLGKPSPGTITSEPESPKGLARPGLSTSMLLQKMCADFSVCAQLAGSRPIPRDAQRRFGWLHDAAVASIPCDTLPLLPFPFCCCTGLSWSRLGSIEQNKRD